MIYGIALCSYAKDGLYSWSLLDDLIFQSKDDAVEHASQHIRNNLWEGNKTYEDEDSWNWRREENDGEMDDLCLLTGDDRAGIIRQVRNLG